MYLSVYIKLCYTRTKDIDKTIWPSLRMSQSRARNGTQTHSTNLKQAMTEHLTLHVKRVLQAPQLGLPEHNLNATTTVYV